MHRKLLATAEKDWETIVVLYYLFDSPMPYATWLAHKDRPKETFYGHYFETLEEAKDDFYLRSAESGALRRFTERLDLHGEDLREVVRGFREE